MLGHDVPHVGPPCEQKGVGSLRTLFSRRTDEQIAACEMVADPDGLEAKLVEEMERTHGHAGGRLLRFVWGERSRGSIRNSQMQRSRDKKSSLVCAKPRAEAEGESRGSSAPTRFIVKSLKF